MKSIESMANTITPEMVAKLLGTSAITVKYCMENGTMPIGIVKRTKEKPQYIIFPKALYDVTGYKLNGYEPPPTAEVKEIDYDSLAKSILAQLVTSFKKEATT